MIERIILIVFFMTWIISGTCTFAFAIISDDHETLEKYAIVCGVVTFVTTIMVGSLWWR